jgi:hypothetical protein
VSLPPNYSPEHPFDNGELRVRDEMLLPHPRTEQAVRQEIAAYYGMIGEVDAQIGRILDAAEVNGQLDNTIVILAGDNGLAVGSHGLLGKQSVYEHSVRVPLILAGPGVPRGERREALAYLFDVFPTIAALSGVTPPSTVQGLNLLPALRNPGFTVRPAAYFAYRDLQRAVRTADDWKLIRYDVRGVQHTQLFNLHDDPFERRSLAGDPTYAARHQELESLLVELGRTYHDPLDLSLPDWGKSASEERTHVDHLANGAAVGVARPFSASYPGRGPAGLTDGVRCTRNHSADCWQGLEQDDLDAIIDLGTARPVSAVEPTFLRNIRAWIFLPVSVEVALSSDGVTYATVATHVTPAATEDDVTGIVEIAMAFEPRTARYLRIRAHNQRICPEWHSGAGGKAWLFVDEIVVQ